MVNRFLSFTARNALRDMNLQPKKAATQRDSTRANTAAQTAPNLTPHQSKSPTSGEESASLAAQQRLQGVGRHASTTEEAAASSQGPGAEAVPADFLEEPPDDLAGADDDEIEGSLKATNDNDCEQAQMAGDAAKEAKLESLLGLTPDELMHELASAGGAVDLRAALD
eukprot:jgi/Tetstr1/432743/TSEL_022109.t1